MKKLTIAIFLACTMSISVYGQNGLSYSQVITDAQSFTVGISQSSATPLLTVPVDKVWKVESISEPQSFGDGSTYLVINGFEFGPGRINSASLPIWLKSGDTVQCGVKKGNNTGGTITASLYISIIEFNEN